jgi:hypothetical protein
MTAITESLPFKTECSQCHALMAAVRGPSSYRSRPPTPQGYRLGYMVELKEHAYPICAACLSRVMNIAA